MKKYLLYEIKKNMFTVCCVTVIATLIYITPMLFDNYYSSYLWLISTIGGVLAFFIPVRAFNYRMKKRSVDLYYSLPLTHTKILFVHFLTGLIALYFIYTVAYWLGAITAIANVTQEIKAIYYIPQYFASLLPIYFIYAISSFTFTRANSTGDGIMFAIFWFFVAFLIANVITIVFYSFATDDFLFLLPFSPLDSVTTCFQRMLRNAQPYFSLSDILGSVYTVLLAAGSTAGLFLLENKTKAENAGQISDSLFGYKIMIHIYTLCLVWLAVWLRSYILTVFIIIAMFILTVAYKRTMKIGKIQAIIFAATVLAGILLGVIPY